MSSHEREEADIDEHQDSDAWNEDGILHYDPSQDYDIINGPMKHSSPLELTSDSSDSAPLFTQTSMKTLKKAPRTKRIPSPKPPLPDRSSSPVDINVSDSQTGPKAKAKKAPKTKAVTLTEDEIHSRLKAHILADTDLHLRILRYEPIPFELFLGLVTGDNSPTGGAEKEGSSESLVKVTGALRLQVRAFLDKQAIQFYDHDAARPRTKRRRRK